MSRTDGAVLNEPGGTLPLPIPGVPAGARRDGQFVAGITPRPGRLRKLKDHAWFAGFAPSKSADRVAV